MSLYETEIEITGKNSTEGAFGSIASALLGLEGQAGKVEAALGRVGGVNKAILAGFTAMVEFGLGEKMAKSLERWVEKAQELSRIHNDMMQIGAGAQISDFDRQSAALSNRYRNLSVTELQKGMRDAIPIFGDAIKAANEFDPVAEFMSTLKAKMGAEHGGEINRQVQAAIKAAEESGAMKPEDVGAFLKNEQKMLFAFGDQVSPSSMLTVQRNLGAYQKDLDDHFRFGILPAMAINQGQRAGTEIATTAAKFVAGIRNSSAALTQMQELGLVQADDLEFNKQGKPVRMKVGHKTALTDDLDKDPLLAVTKDLLPRILGKYGSDPIVMRQVIGRLAGDKTAISGITDLAINATRYEKDAANVERVDPNFEHYRERSGDYAKQSIEAQHENLQVALGMPATGPVREAMNLFAAAEAAVANAALKHPDITAFATAMTAVGSVALEVAGSLTGAVLLAKFLGFGGKKSATTPPAGPAPRSAAANDGGWFEDLMSGKIAKDMEAIDAGTVAETISKVGLGTMLKSGLKGGVIGGAVDLLGKMVIDKVVPMIGGHSQEEHERLQKQGPEHFWSGLFGSAEAATAPSLGGYFGMRPADSLDRVRDRNAQIYGGADMNPRGSYYHAADYGDRMADRDKAVMDALEQLGDAGRKTGQEFAALQSPMQQFGASLGALAGMMGGLSGIGAGGAGGGFMKASYTTWGGGNGGSGWRNFGGDSGTGFGRGGVMNTTGDPSIPVEGRALLDAIAGGEAQSYTERNRAGGAATGRYQFEPATWRRVANALGLQDMSPGNQDRAGWWLAQQDYRSNTGRDLLGDLKDKHYDLITRGLRGTWPSMPGGSQQNTSRDTFDRRMESALAREALGGPPVLDRYMKPGGMLTNADLARYNADRAAYLAKPPPPAPLRAAPQVSPQVQPTTHDIEAALHRALGKVEMKVAVVYDKQHQAHVSKFVTAHLANRGQFPTAMGGPDPHGHYVSPGTPVPDAA